MDVELNSKTEKLYIEVVVFGNVVLVEPPGLTEEGVKWAKP